MKTRLMIIRIKLSSPAMQYFGKHCKCHPTYCRTSLPFGSFRLLPILCSNCWLDSILMNCWLDANLMSWWLDSNLMSWWLDSNMMSLAPTCWSLTTSVASQSMVVIYFRSYAFAPLNQSRVVALAERLVPFLSLCRLLLYPCRLLLYLCRLL